MAQQTSVVQSLFNNYQFIMDYKRRPPTVSSSHQVFLSKEDSDFILTMEDLRVTYLQISNERQFSGFHPGIMTTVYNWISALKMVECADSFKKVCLRNQMAIDLLKQLQNRSIEWPFDQPQAHSRLREMMQVAGQQVRESVDETRSSIASQRGSFSMLNEQIKQGLSQTRNSRNAAHSQSIQSSLQSTMHTIRSSQSRHKFSQTQLPTDQSFQNSAVTPRRASQICIGKQKQNYLNALQNKYKSRSASKSFNRDKSECSSVGATSAKSARRKTVTMKQSGQIVSRPTKTPVKNEQWNRVKVNNMLAQVKALQQADPKLFRYFMQEVGSIAREVENLKPKPQNFQIRHEDFVKFQRTQAYNKKVVR
ncbi:hypothetical protein FGO68_gene16200 [Halteria grandinella]|uniref:Uncharacterized protein n=1 Tax=Halteria grandinella TaxID=5974 RepID=A0A8J8NUW9_HALGN|nr:hypothetical protein FGO68_gene16200 [Halteria grandinella]